MVLGSRPRPRSQRLPELECCKRLVEPIVLLLIDGPGLLETGDCPVVLPMPGQALPYLNASLIFSNTRSCLSVSARPQTLSYVSVVTYRVSASPWVPCSTRKLLRAGPRDAVSRQHECMQDLVTSSARARSVASAEEMQLSPMSSACGIAAPRRGRACLNSKWCSRTSQAAAATCW